MIDRSTDGVGEVGELAARMMPYTSRTRPTMESTTPSGSIRPGFGSLESGTSTTIAISATITIGTLTRKIEPHQKCSSSSPPVIGPMAMARPTLPAQMPMALGCSSRSKTFIRTARVAGITKAAPKPITARKRDELAGRAGHRGEGRADAEDGDAEEQDLLAAERSPSRPAVKSSPAKTSV